jgi:iron-sulfur cluster assembly protein
MDTQMVSTKLTVTVTDLAAQKIKRALERRGRGEGIMIGVKTTGCSGLAYVLEYVDNPNLHCVAHVDSNGVRVFVDPKYVSILNGVTIDYQRQGLNEGFEFINKNERDRCGCGESFRI